MTVMIPHLARVCVLAMATAWVHANVDTTQSLQRRVPKQIHTKAAVVETEDDHKPEESHFGAEAAHHHPHGHGKYFMYQHVPHKDHYEFGYRRGNDHHFKERYEKAQPHHGHFKTKARWGDKHGGYGEHYWDYNHGGHHGDDEGGSDDEGGDGSNPVPDYHPRGDDLDDRIKRDHESTTTTATPIANTRHVRRPSDSPENLDHQGQETTDSSAYQRPGSGRSASPTYDHPGLSLAYDTESGTVVDEATGRRFLLTPIN